VKIVFWEIHSATVFGDEGVPMAQSSPRFVKLEPGSASEPYCWHASLVESYGKVVKAEETFSSGRNQRIYRDVEDAGGLAQSRPQKAGLIVAKFEDGSEIRVRIRL